MVRGGGCGETALPLNLGGGGGGSIHLGQACFLHIISRDKEGKEKTHRVVQSVAAMFHCVPAELESDDDRESAAQIFHFVIHTQSSMWEASH